MSVIGEVVRDCRGRGGLQLPAFPNALRALCSVDFGPISIWMRRGVGKLRWLSMGFCRGSNGLLAHAEVIVLASIAAPSSTVFVPFGCGRHGAAQPAQHKTSRKLSSSSVTADVRRSRAARMLAKSRSTGERRSFMSRITRAMRSRRSAIVTLPLVVMSLTSHLIYIYI